MRPLLAVGVVLWFAATGAGIWTVWAYANEPGRPAAAPATWPAADNLAAAPDRPTLVLLAHPQCTCTQASIAELAEVLGRATRAPRAYVLFLKPLGMPDGWVDTSLWDAAARLPGVTVLRDDEGAQARRLGAFTSGQVVLYAADGALLFSGGITSSRGHAGENQGRSALIALLNDSGSDVRSADVFGCPIFSEQE